MHYPTAILRNASNHLQKVFAVDPLPATDLEALYFKLSRVVLHLLQTDLNRLLHVLYRIDVDELQVKQAMVADDVELIAERLAKLIVARELQKAQLRARYSQN